MNIILFEFFCPETVQNIANNLLVPNLQKIPNSPENSRKIHTDSKHYAELNKNINIIKIAA